METIESTHTAQIHGSQAMLPAARFLHIFASLPMLSGEILHQAEEGEAYEVLVRRIKVLHQNIVELAEQARQVQD